LGDVKWIRIRKILQGIFGLVFLITFCLHWQFERRFQFHPTAPDISAGRVVPYELQGTKYLTAEEYDRSWWLWRIALGSMTTAILLQVIWPRHALPAKVWKKPVF
jgi:hypothetical protein